MFTLPTLPYNLNALEPYISEHQLDVHYNKHHKAYVDKLNELTNFQTNFKYDNVEAILRHAGLDPAYSGSSLFNNAAQYWNHNFFWKSMKPASTPAPASGQFEEAVKQSFGSIKLLMESWLDKAGKHFGSGWIWLYTEAGINRLQIMTTHDADTPIMTIGLKPILCCDLWEHAYYIDYENDKNKFYENFIYHLANWKFAGENYEGM